MVGQIVIQVNITHDVWLGAEFTSNPLSSLTADLNVQRKSFMFQSTESFGVSDEEFLLIHNASIGFVYF